MTTARVVSSPEAVRLRNALKELSRLRNLEVRIGWFSSAKYEDGTPVAYVAAIQEFGYAPKHIVARMGLRGEMIPKKQKDWAEFLERSARMILAGEWHVRDALEAMGSRVAADVQKQIASVKEPLLAIPTLEARARRRGLEHWTDLSATGQKPLSDTGLMHASVTYMIADGRSE